MRALALSLRGIFLSFCYKFVTSVKLPYTTVTVHNFLYGKMSAIALLFQGYPPSFVKAEYLKMHARFIQSRHHPRLVLVNEIYHSGEAYHIEIIRREFEGERNIQCVD